MNRRRRARSPRFALTLVLGALVFGWPQLTPPACAAGVYAGPPKLELGLAVVLAGDGPAGFKTTTLIGVLAGPGANAEVAKLTKRYGARVVKSAIVTLDFFVADALRQLKQQGLALPAAPAPDPKDGSALVAALYAAGTDAATGTFDVDYLLDHLVSHPVRVRIMRDIDARYGEHAGTTYRVVLGEVLDDLQK